MRRRLLVSILISGLAAAGDVQACLEPAVAAFTGAVEGRSVDKPSVRGCRPPDLDLPPPGSGNWPILISAALYLDGSEDERWLLPWLSGADGKWGHNGREGGSTIYEGLNWAAALAVRHRACSRPSDAALCRAAGGWLRAGYAKWALAATSQAPARIVFRQGTQIARRNRLDVVGYHGPFAHLPGDRQAERPDRGQFVGSWVDLHPVNPLLAWAADVPGRRYREDQVTPTERALPLWVASALTGRSYSEELPLDFAGLTAAERDALRRFLAMPTDGDLAAPLVAWLDTYPSRSRRVTYRRYASGEVVTVASHTTNANKSGATVVAGFADRSAWLLPSTYKGVGAATAHGELRADRAVATSNDGGRLELDLSGLGPVAWEVLWSPEGARFAEGSGFTVPELDEPTPASCRPSELGDAVKTIACLRARPSTPDALRALLGPLGEIVRLTARYEESAGDDRRRVLEELEAEARTLAETARAARAP
ncbi:MAG: hypothetical protein AAFX50_12130 [Acidobacteriota bacterium]